MKTKIPFNTTYVELNIPRKNIANFVESEDNLIPGTNRDKLEAAFDYAKENKLEEAVKNRKISIIVEDHTREVPFEDRFCVLFPKLKLAHNIKIFIATGTHDGQVEGNFKIRSFIEKYTETNNLNLNKVIIHDCHQDNFYFAGTTSIGNDIYANLEIQDSEIIIILSDMKNHYFAGYSNPIKSLLPGICKYETVERNHALTLNDNSTFGRHPLHPDEHRRDNPLAKDMYEGFKLIAGNRQVFVLGTICNHSKILWARFGSLADVTSEGILQVDKMTGVSVQPTDKLIVSAGGYPNDESLYIAQRALELTKNAIKNRGEILFIAGCANGIGPKKSVNNFYEPLKDDIDWILSKLSDKYKMYSHKTFKFAQLIQRMKSIYFYSELNDKEIESIHLKPINSPQDIVDRWLTSNEKVKINIFAEGNKVAVYSN